MLAIIGALVLFGGAILLYRAARSSRRPRVGGEVIELLERPFPNPSGRLLPHAKVRYLVDGIEREAVVLAGEWTARGARVELCYPPDSPAQVELAVIGRELGYGLLLVLAGGSTLFLAWWMAQQLG